MTYLRTRPEATRPLRPRWIACLTVLAASLTLTGCDIAGLGDIGTTLLDPDAALLDSPGRKIASGVYSNLVVDGSLESGGNVVAIRWDLDESTVSIVPFLEGDGCNISPGITFERISSRVDVALEGLVAVQRSRDDNGRGLLSFVGFDCKSRIADLEDSSMPLVGFPSLEPRGMLTITEDGTLRLVDASTQKLEHVADDVSFAQVTSGRLWTLEGGQMVLRNDDLKELASNGTGVTSFITTGGDEISAVFRDDGGLWAFNEDDGASLISETGCQAHDLGPDAVAYFDPCEERRLNIVTQGEKLGHSGRVILQGPADVVRLDRLVTRWGHGKSASEFTLIQNTSSGKDTGTVVHITIPEGAEFADEPFQMEGQVLLDSGTIRSSQLYADWNGTSGHLMELDRDDDEHVIGVKEIARDVAQMHSGSPYSERGILDNFADGLGELVVLKKDGEKITRTVLASRVPVQTLDLEPEAGDIAFIGEVDGSGAGKLFLLRSGKAPIAVARKVFPDTARFLDQPRGIAYLADTGSDSSAGLHAWLRDSDLDILIHKQASEYRMVPWPSPGVLYAVPEGKDQGLWFSKAR